MEEPHMTHRRLVAITLAVLFLSNGLTGCSSCNPSNKRIECIDPVTGQIITTADDIEPTTPGIQIAVRCTITGFDIGDFIDLNAHDDIAGGDRTYSIPYDGTGTIEFRPVSLQGGTSVSPSRYTFIASGDDGDVESNAVTVDVVAEIVTCPEFDFIDPVDGEEWNQSDDSVGDISDGFQHDVVITTDAGDAESVSLYLNDALVGTGTVDGTRIEFTDVTFPSGGGDMVLRIQTTEACYAEATVTIDDGSPACNIAAPLPIDPSGWINATFDTSTSAGMQADITVETENGATVELFVDIPLTETPTLTGTADSSGALTFSAVELAEAAFGELTLQARCRDTAGNPGVSALTSYGVDSIVPTIAITEPTGGEHYNDTDDVLPGESGIQIDVSVDTDQPTTSVMVGPSADGCVNIDADSGYGIITTDTDGNGTGQASLGGTDGNVDICARVTKISGNSATAGPVTVNLDTELPQVQISDPTPGFELLISNDMDTGTAGGQWTVEVECDSIGGTVELFANTSGTPVSIASPIACVTDTGSSLGGLATFTTVTIPEGAVTLTAEHIDLALNSNTSTGVAIEVDTEAPVVSIFLPTCGSTFHASGSYFTDIRVLSTDGPVTLTVTDSGGSGVGSSPYTQTLSGGAAYFSSIELAQGTNSVEACATDDHAQSGCSPACSYTVEDLPFVNVTTPTDGSLLGLKDDVDTGTAGLQVNVTVISDVASGVTVTLYVGGSSVGSMPYAGSGITFTGITLPEGTGITIRAEATDTRGTGTDTNTVDVDITPPGTAITDLAITVLSRRGGNVELSWTAPSDGGAAVSDYDIRCAMTDIVTEGDFSSATPYTFPGVPASPGSGETAAVSNLFVGLGTQHYCAVKSLDAALNASAMSNVPNVTLEYMTHRIEGPTGTAYQFGFYLGAAGDVNGDTIEDIIVGAYAGDRAYLFFGDSSGSLPTTPDVTFTAPGGSYFGYSAHGIGNFDGDSSNLSEIAIGAPLVGGGKGAVYVYKGRTTWPATVATTSADLTIRLDDPASTSDDGSLFGYMVEPAGDFNNDGELDLVATAIGWDAYRGASFIVLGRNSFTSGSAITVPGDRTTGLVGDFMIAGFEATSRFGISVSHLGLVNTDARDDLVIGARDAATTGRAYVFFGRADAGSGLTNIVSANQTINSPDSGAIRFGFSTGGPGDVNGDGRPDLVVSAPFYNTNQGRMYVFYNSGGTGFNSTPNMTISNGSGAPANDYFGYTIGKGEGLGFYTDGDFDGDGTNDLNFFSHRYGANSCTGFLEFGSSSISITDSENADIIFPYAGTDPGGLNGWGAIVGDVNDDGYPDTMFSFYTENSNQGAAVIYY